MLSARTKCIKYACHSCYINPLQWRHNVRDGAQITSVEIFCSTVSSGAYHRKHQSSASLAFVRPSPMNSPHKWPVTRKMFPFDDVIILCGRWAISEAYDYAKPHSYNRTWECSIDQLNNNVHGIYLYLKITNHSHPIQEKVETTFIEYGNTKYLVRIFYLKIVMIIIMIW